jgi:hypothetical protein
MFYPQGTAEVSFHHVLAYKIINKRCNNENLYLEYVKYAHSCLVSNTCLIAYIDTYRQTFELLAKCVTSSMLGMPICKTCKNLLQQVKLPHIVL